MAEKAHLVLASDANYRPGLEITRTSIARSCSTPERIVWHVFREEDLAKLDLSGLPPWNSSRMPYLRLWLPEILRDVDYVVYSDVDTIWNRDVCELLANVTQAHEDAGEPKSIHWVRDFTSMKNAAGDWISRVVAGEGLSFDWTRYACSGVCVMNLKKMRENGFTQRVQDLFSRYGVPKFPDQDVLNVLFNADSCLLPCVWDVLGDCSNLPRLGEPCVYHLTGVGRHFHDATPPVYPPQYLYWWLIRNSTLPKGKILFVYRALARLWWAHGLTRLLPLSLRERIVRQWFFTCVLCRQIEAMRP